MSIVKHVGKVRCDIRRMTYSQDIMEEIKARNDIVGVVSEYVKLDRRGSNYMGLCPFHKEKTPSFSVSSTKQLFYCFGCQKGGNVINFISLAEGLDYGDSIRLLAERAGITLPESNNKDEEQKHLVRQSIIEANTEAAKFFFSNLSKSEVAMNYLKKRGISDKTIRSFGLGYSEDSGYSLYNHLKKKGFKDDLLIKSGLVLESKNGGLYDRFRNRVMFPIFDVMGKVIGFGGRVLDDSVPKYLNSPETPVYNKGRNLYALNFARKQKNKQLIIVEGYMDVISLHQYGVTNVVATLGTALTENQGRLLKKYCEEVIISFDADGAGRNAALRGLDILNGVGCRMRVLTIPDGKDPDEFVKKNGTTKFLSLVNNAVTLVEYKVNSLKKDIDTNTLEGKIDFLDKLSVILSKVDNLVERDIYIKKFAGQYGITPEALKAEVIKKTNAPELKRTIRSIAETLKPHEILSEDLEKISHDERMIIALICLENDVYKRLKGTLTEDFFQVKANKDLAGKIFSILDNNDEVTIDRLFDMVIEAEQNIFAKIVYSECNCDDNFKAVIDLMKRIEQTRLANRQKEILELLKDLSIPKEERIALEKELKDIMVRKR